MIKDQTEKVKNCFIISPFGEEGSTLRTKLEGLIKASIEPAATALGFRAFSSLDIKNGGSISNQVIEHLVNDDLVIADLTDFNGNVMYELAVRHAVRKPVVLLLEHGNRLPFDLNQERVVMFNRDMLGGYKLQLELKQAINTAMNDDNIDNPVFRVLQQSILKKDIKPGSFEDFLLVRLNQIDSKVSKVEYFDSLAPHERGRFIFKYRFQGIHSEYQPKVWDAGFASGISPDIMSWNIIEQGSELTTWIYSWSQKLQFEKLLHEGGLNYEVIGFQNFPMK